MLIVIKKYSKRFCNLNFVFLTAFLVKQNLNSNRFKAKQKKLHELDSGKRINYYRQ